MYEITTCSSTDWIWTEIEIQDDKASLLADAYGTPEQYAIYQQGIQEGWITIIGPVNDNTSN